MNNLSYNENLLKLLNNEKDEYLLSDELLLNLYMTLISINNSNYNEKLYKKEQDILEDFLRKINNLKVKIQLKRKPEEIDNLTNEIKTIYNINKRLIDNYNLDNLSIVELLDTKEPNKITNLIDNLTKEKINNQNNKDKYDTLRNDIINNIFTKPHHIANNTLYIEESNISISLDEFYKIFTYLLNIDNYSKKYSNDTVNKLSTQITTNIIDIITKKTIPDDITIIPIILSNTLSKDIPNYTSIDTSKFNIDNIKITDLYSFAKNNNEKKETAKWKNIIIPNEYLYQKIKELSKKGMYYKEDDKFIIENNPNDFKISITIPNMKLFLSQNITNIINQST